MNDKITTTQAINGLLTMHQHAAAVHGMLDELTGFLRGDDDVPPAWLDDLHVDDLKKALGTIDKTLLEMLAQANVERGGVDSGKVIDEALAAV